MYKGKAFFYEHVLAPIPQLKKKRDGVQCAAGTEQLTGEFPSLHSSKGNGGVETRERILCASNSSIINIQLYFFGSEEAQELPAPHTTQDHSSTPTIPNIPSRGECCDHR